MAIERDQPVAVIQEHRVAVEEEVSRDGDPPRRRGDDGCARGGGDVQPAMRAAGFAVQDAAAAEGPRDGARHWAQEGVEVSGRGGHGGVGRLHPHALVPDARQILRAGVDVARVGDGEALHGIVLCSDLKRHFHRAAIAIPGDDLVAPRLRVQRQADQGVAAIEQGGGVIEPSLDDGRRHRHRDNTTGDAHHRAGDADRSRQREEQWRHLSSACSAAGAGRVATTVASMTPVTRCASMRSPGARSATSVTTRPQRVPSGRDTTA